MTTLLASQYRIAIVNKDKCKPTKCKRECISGCPPQQRGKEVIRLVDIEDVGKPMQHTKPMTKKQIAQIVENDCIGCNMCVKRCPFDAISIVNLPHTNPADLVHQYGPNSFRLYKLPELGTNRVVGIIGENGVGKTTLINILCGRQIPSAATDATQQAFVAKYRGSTMHTYLTKLYRGELRCTIKEQKIKQTATQNQTVAEFIGTTVAVDAHMYREFAIDTLCSKRMFELSGGELQRVLCYSTISQQADVYIFDEPSNFLDIKQRLVVSRYIRKLATVGKYVIVIDHDMSMLDYMADEVHIIYGKANSYGIVSGTIQTAEGINQYLDGFIVSENVRFRAEPFKLQAPQTDASDTIPSGKNHVCEISYSDITVTYPGFQLNIPADTITLNHAMYVILGENGTGKTTLMQTLASTTGLTVSMKEQTLSFTGGEKGCPSVEAVFYAKIREAYLDPVFIHEVIDPLGIRDLLGQRMDLLSGGNLQKVLLVLCLGTPADVYFVDEPSANLDIEKRLAVIRVLNKFVSRTGKCMFVVEHDIMMAVAFAQSPYSKIISIEGHVSPSMVQSTVSTHLEFGEGICRFLKQLGITMRVAQKNNRPRINKHGSQIEKGQLLSGNYYA
jgi:ATP-binding cassette subfamily E protein 1